MALEGDAVQPIFRNLSADDADPETTEIESLCMNCGDNGITRLLLTKIPFYKEVIIMSFSCDKCGFRNNELQPGGRIEEKGVRITVKVRQPSDLNRRVVKSDYTSVQILELDFEIPAQSQKGEVTTLEGVVERCISGLEQDQAKRREQNPETASQIHEFVGKLKELKELKNPYTMIFRDISGNSFVENPSAPQTDPGVETTHFIRSRNENHLLAIYTPEEVEGSSEKGSGIMKPIPENSFTIDDLHSEIHQFQTNCPNCMSPCETNMKVTNIPHFKEVLIMATNCEACGHRSNEVKSGGGIEPLGLRIQIRVTDRDDFSRDVLKSETCHLSVPEMDLEVGPAALGGRFTTVEGILTAMRDQLADKGSMFTDSADSHEARRLGDFIGDFDVVLAGKKPVTLVLDDPAGNSYVQSLFYPEDDPGLTISRYERTFDHNEELGLNDMKTEGYEQHHHN